MFEGVVSQVLAGYLGRYVKGIQKDQLKIGIWNEEILLENVELILEAFDYLKLPIALRQGRIGKLSIKIPWKRLGWDSINIVLEDVFLSACRRDDNEWTYGSVEKRELAAKMAKLNAAELAKFSKCVSDNQAGQSFISYISTKILDNIQVYIKNVHVVYTDTNNDLVSPQNFFFGFRLSSLTMKTDPQKQSSILSYGLRFKGGQVHKIIDMAGFGIYCNSSEEHPNSIIDENYQSSLIYSANSNNELNDYLVSPFDVTVYLLVNKSVMLDGFPQYTVGMELDSLVILLNENQLRQILSLWDYLSICSLREKYGRYRPSQMSRNIDGWQRKWWSYAQESILSDVRSKLRKNCWRNLGKRINCRRKYVNLYKRKLEIIQLEQSVNNDILKELEQLDEECDFEDILSYRSIAEKQLQETLVKTRSPKNKMVVEHADGDQEIMKNDGLKSSGDRSWLSWLSLGMLGAGGTADTSLFSGVVSDEIIRDIYEATEFHPSHSFDGDIAETNKFYISSIKVNIGEISLTITSRTHVKDVARVLCDEVGVEYKIWDDKTEVMASINSAKMVNPCNEDVMLVSRKGNLVAEQNPFVNVHLKISPANEDSELSVVLQPFEVTCDLAFLQNLSDFQHILFTFQFHNKRVLSSLNGFEDIKTRLLLKIEYILSAYRKLMWVATFNDVVLTIPWTNGDPECLSLVVLKFKTLTCRSRLKMENIPFLYVTEDYFGYSMTNILSTSSGHLPLPLQLCDLYDHFEMELVNLEGQIVRRNSSQVHTVIEKSAASAAFGLCVILDEPVLRQFEVYHAVASVGMCLSQLICSQFAELVATLSWKEAESRFLRNHDFGALVNDRTRILDVFQYSLAVKIESITLRMNFEDDAGGSSVICFTFKNITTWCSAHEYLNLVLYMTMVEANIYTAGKGYKDIILCSFGKDFASTPLDMDYEIASASSPGNIFNHNHNHGECFILHYQSQRSTPFASHECFVTLNNLDLHIHPKIFGLLQQIHDSWFENFVSLSGHSKSDESELNEEFINEPIIGVGLEKQGFSNYFDVETSTSGISLDRFPFVLVQNSGILSNLESSFTLNIPEWRNLQMKDKLSPQCHFSDFKKILTNATSNQCSFSGTSLEVNVHVVDVSLSGIRIHFHDSSCVVGTIILPLVKSYLSFKGSNCWDLLCSAEGLSLLSPWYGNNRVLLGKALPNISPILNIRARKQNIRSKVPVTEISFGIQHVNCTLPSEFLAMIIGYLSLPDWKLKGNNKESDLENEWLENGEILPFDIVYKFEILGSTLGFPLENVRDSHLQLDLPLVYCCFIPKSHPDNALKYFPQDDMLLTPILTDILNIFGHNLEFNIWFKCDNQSLVFTEHSSAKKISFVEKFDANLWIRIPSSANQLVDQSSVATEVVVKAGTLNFIAQDENFVSGVQAIVDVIDQLSAVGKESNFFKTDVLQFIKLIRSLKKTHSDMNTSSKKSLVNIKMTINVLSIKLNCLTVKKGSPPEVMAEAKMQVVFAASMEDDTLVDLDAAISGLVLHSVCSSVLLLSSGSQNSVSQNIWINFCKSDQCEMNVIFTINFVDIWLHFSDWMKLIDLVQIYIHAPNGGSLGNGSEFQTTENVSDDAVYLIMKSENVSISFHLPLRAVSDSLPRFGKAKLKEIQHHLYVENDLPDQDKYCRFLKFALKSEEIELISNNGCVKLKSSIKKIRVILEVVEKSKVSSMPFILISKVQVAAELLKKQQQSMKIVSGINIYSIDVGMSYDVFTFCHGLHFMTFEEASSEVPLYAMDFSIDLHKVSILISDGKWTYTGPVIEILINNALLKANKMELAMEVSLICKLLINYNNIHKVMWEPFIEPWSFQFRFVRKWENIMLNLSGVSDICLKSTDQLNLNITEPLIEAISRVVVVLNGGRKNPEECEFHDSWATSQLPSSNDLYTRRHAPYILCNETSLPLFFWVSHGPTDVKCLENYLQPGSSLPIYVEETLDNKCFVRNGSHSSEKLLSDRGKNNVSHHMISIKIDGTSRPSKPMSMDLVGARYFEVNFSDSGESARADLDEGKHDQIKNIKKKLTKTDSSSGFVVPVVFDVSLHGYSKFIRLYSTVILFNALSVPLELRFDIPFGISPKILDPILPLQEFPLPVHLAEAGQMRWRPVGSDYLWSDSYSLSNLLSKEYKSGILKSFVCYPYSPTSKSFRCCISVEDHSFLSGGLSRKSFPSHLGGIGSFTSDNDQHIDSHELQNNWRIRQVKLTTPLLVKNCLPSALALTIDTGGVSHHIVLSEDDGASVFHVDSTHDLNLIFQIKGFMPTNLKFLRAETFMVSAKLIDSKFSLSDAVAFYPNTSHGSLSITVEKTMDVYCGAREVNLSVPFLLYNCTEIPLVIVDDDLERKGYTCILPTSFDLIGQEQNFYEENGLALLSFDTENLVTTQGVDNVDHDSFPNDFPVSSGRNANHDHVLSRRCLLKGQDNSETSLHSLKEIEASSAHSKLSSNSIIIERKIDLKEKEEGRKVKACMYSPSSDSSVTELMVRLRTHFPHSRSETSKSDVWSSSFYLVPPSGSTNIIVPHPCNSGAFLLSVTSTPAEGLLGKTRSVIFQPRYVICNACSKTLCYKQKGTNLFYHLGVGQHSHLHWTDKKRELLISLRFNEPGGQWSGGFLPDTLGDAQVKMRNYVTGAMDMVRVEVQNADMLAINEETFGHSNETSGTQLILLSDDDTGFMPYRIDNFSMERLRVYQQKCEKFETIVHSYTSCQYAWDEPCYPHRLLIEVPGECVLGSYNFDDLTNHTLVCLRETLEKPERKFFIGVHAEGAIKVLTVIDSCYHSLKDIQETSFLDIKGKRKADDKPVEFTERMTIQLPFIGLSLIDSSPQELIFACAKDTTIVFMQNLDEQKVSFQVQSLQIDNQLRYTPYPIMLSIDHEHKDSLLSHHTKNEPKQKIQVENVANVIFDSKYESIFHFSAAKWRTKESSLISFEHIYIRFCPLRIELEEQVVLHLLDFSKTITSKLGHSRTMQIVNPELQTFDCCSSGLNNTPSNFKDYKCKKCSSSEFISSEFPNYLKNHENHPSLPSVVPIGAPWQQISILARKKKQIYFEVFELSPIKFTLSFSSAPWMIRNESNKNAESLLHFSSIKFQRGLMALVDIEGVPVHLGELKLTHLMASSKSVEQILIRHYTKQLLQEMYKVFGSAGVIGNPMGFARNFGLGLKDFLSVSAKSVVQNPSEVITGMAQGSKSLLSNTVYAISSATTQFSKAAHKGIIAFTFDEQAAARINNQQKGLESRGRGVLNEFLDGLTGLLQSPIRGAEEHGLPGVLSGIAVGTAGLIARPVASILEATGKTAQSIRNRSSPYHFQRYRVRLPRPVARNLPLLPYSWEEAIGVLVLQEADESRLKDEIFVICKSLKQGGRFIVVTKRIILVVSCSSLVGLNSPDFVGVVTDLEWIVETEMDLESIIHIDRFQESVNIVGSNTDVLMRQKKNASRSRKWSPPASVPLSHMCIECSCEIDAEEVLQIMNTTIEQGHIHRWGMHVIHRSNLI